MLTIVNIDPQPLKPISPTGRRKSTITQKQTPRDIQRHTELIDQRDNLQKMEHELREQTTIPPLTTRQRLVRRQTDLPLVDIYCISAVGFYQNLIQPSTKAFTTSLYKIDRMIEQKEIDEIWKDAAQQELTNE